jgi:hypothetical protein
MEDKANDVDLIERAAECWLSARTAGKAPSEWVEEALICREFSLLCPVATHALKRSSLLPDVARNVRTWILPILAMSLLLTASPSPGASLESAHGCHRYTSTGDVAARELALTAETGAETIATDHNGTYNDVSLTTLHKLEPSMPISPRQAHREHEGAYLLSASGTKNSYVVTTQSQDGDTYTLRRASDGSIARYGHVCGKGRNW